MSMSHMQKQLWPFNDFMKSRRPYWIFFFEIDWGPGPHIASGYTDGHRVEMYVSITNAEGVMAILMISRSRGGHSRILFWK